MQKTGNHMKVFKLLFVTFSLLYTVCVNAGNTTGTVNEVYVLGFKDAITFSLNSENQNFDACAETAERYGVSTSTEQGRVIFSTILAAKASKQTIKVFGLGDKCTVHGDAEDLNYLIIK
ncbi:MAG: hypothetical protein K6L73_15000 [Cellvibrionaceae bacterium]